MQGQATDLDVHAREILRQRALLIDLYHRHTGRDSEQIGRDIERDYHMTAEQAVAYGMIDQIIEKPARRGDRAKRRPGDCVSVYPASAALTTDRLGVHREVDRVGDVAQVVRTLVQRDCSVASSPVSRWSRADAATPLRNDRRRPVSPPTFRSA